MNRTVKTCIARTTRPQLAKITLRALTDTQLRNVVAATMGSGKQSGPM